MKTQTLFSSYRKAIHEMNNDLYWAFRAAKEVTREHHVQLAAIRERQMLTFGEALTRRITAQERHDKELIAENARQQLFIKDLQERLHKSNNNNAQLRHRIEFERTRKEAAIHHTEEILHRRDTHKVDVDTLLRRLEEQQHTIAILQENGLRMAWELDVLKKKKFA